MKIKIAVQMINFERYYVTLNITVGKEKYDTSRLVSSQGTASYEFGPYPDQFVAEAKASDLANHIAARMGTLLLEGFEA